MSRSARKTEALMRQMGSTTGDWNPVPTDQQLFLVLYPALRVLPTVEILTVQWVQWKTLDRYKGAETPRERTPQANDQRGDLTLKHMAEDLRMDMSNLSKIVARVEELGFYWRDDHGVFHLNAGALSATRTKGESKKGGGLYKPLPDYVIAHLKGLNEIARAEFMQKWVAAEQWQNAALAQAKVTINQEMVKRQRVLCQGIGIELKTAKGRPKVREKDNAPEPEIVRVDFVKLPDQDWFVQTSNVQTASAGVVQSEPDFVQDSASLLVKNEKFQRREKLVRTPVENEPVKPEPHAKKEPDVGLQNEVALAIYRSKLVAIDGKEQGQATIRNIAYHLERLPSAVDIRQVIDILEDKCRGLYERPSDGIGKTWGWIVGAVRSEVELRLGEEPDLQEQMKAAVAKKGMR